MRRLIPLLGLLASLFATSLAAQAPVPPSADGATLLPGDSIYIDVWRQQELSGGFQVAANGGILHPLYQEIVVVGVPLSAVHERVAAMLRRFEENPEFVVQPLMRVAVGGEVKNPNLYYMDPGVTIPQAVSMAGGATDNGRRDRVRLVRDGTETLLRLNDPSGEALRMGIRSGDQIRVERKTNVLRDYLFPAASAVSALGTLYAFVFGR